MMLALLLAAAAAAPAKAGPVDRLHKVVVDAIRNCQQPEEGEIVVCARDRGLAEGFRLPKLDQRFAGSALRPSGRGELTEAGAGASGTGSCSASGASGSTGCALREYDKWGAEKRRAKADGERWYPW